MKFSDMLKFSASYLKKHKARFLITTVYSFLLILLIFVIIYSAFSVVATARRDVEEYAHQSGNVAEVRLSNLTIASDDGVYHCFPTREEIAFVLEGLESAGATTVQVTEQYRMAEFMGTSVFPGKMNESVTVVEGKGLAEAGESSIWITEQSARQLERFGIGIGSSIKVKGPIVDGRFTIAGIVRGEGEAYAREEDMVRLGLIMLDATYSVQLESGSYAEVGELTALISQLKDTLETYNGVSRSIYCGLANHYESLTIISGIFAAALAVAAAFCTLLLLSVLRNNSVIGIYDNIGFYAMLTCMGIKRRDVNVIAVLETLVCVIISAFAAMGISVLLGSASAGIAGAMLSEFLAATSGGVFAWAWWVDILYIAALAAFVVVYFVLTLQKVLAKRNLLSVLRSEL